MAFELENKNDTRLTYNKYVIRYCVKLFSLEMEHFIKTNLNSSDRKLTAEFYFIFFK